MPMSAMVLVLKKKMGNTENVMSCNYYYYLNGNIGEAANFI